MVKNGVVFLSSFLTVSSLFCKVFMCFGVFFFLLPHHAAHYDTITN